jgi:hypothetical protein
MDVCVCVYSAIVLSCVYVGASERADLSSMESYRLCKKDYGTDEEARSQQLNADPLMYVRMYVCNFLMTT